MTAAWALRRPATNAPTISTQATTQIVAMMLPEAWVVIVSEPPDDDEAAAVLLSAAARATGDGVGATTGAAVGAGAGEDVGLPGLGEGEGVGLGVIEPPEALPPFPPSISGPPNTDSRSSLL